MRAIAERVPFHYGWVILFAGILANAVAAGGTFWAVTIYVPAISDDFGVSRFAVVAAFMVGQTITALIGPFVGRYIDLHGARGALLAGSVALPLAVLATAAASELWQLLVGWGLVSAARSLLMPIPYNWLLTRWFARRRQAALGVVTVGFGLGGAAILPVLAAVEGRGGWPASMVVSAALIFVVHGLAALLIVRDRPSELGMAPEGAAGSDSALGADEEGGFTASQAMRTAPFWLLALGLMFFFMGQGAVSTLAIDFFDSRDVANGAAIITAGALVRTLLRLPLGLSLSRVKRIYGLAMIVATTQAAAVAVLVASTSAGGLVLYIALWGVGGAFAPMLEPLLIMRAFGVRHFGAVSGTVAMVAFGGQMIGPLGGAALFDASGSYTLAFALYAAGFMVAVALFAGATLGLRAPSHRAAASRAGMASP